MSNELHGGNIWRFPQGSVLDFSASINPFGMPPEVKDAAIRGVDASVHYPDPDCTALRGALSEVLNVPADWILCGSGGAELLIRLAQVLRPCRALVPAPTFGEYARALEQAGCSVERYFLARDRQFDLDCGFLAALSPETELLVLCNPNNPTGRVISPPLLRAILGRCRELNIRLLMDESFLELTDEEARFSLLPELGNFPNLLLLRSMTKSYAMPGLRLGYLLTSDTALLGRLSGEGQPWPVSVPAQFAGIAAANCPGWPGQAMEAIRPERERLNAALEALGFDVTESRANFLLFRAPGGESLGRRLAERGILIRSCGNFPGLTEEDYRVAVRTREENDRFLSALNGILKGRE